MVFFLGTVGVIVTALAEHGPAHPCPFSELYGGDCAMLMEHNIAFHHMNAFHAALFDSVVSLVIVAFALVVALSALPVLLAPAQRTALRTQAHDLTCRHERPPIARSLARWLVRAHARALPHALFGAHGTFA